MYQAHSIDDKPTAARDRAATTNHSLRPLPFPRWRIRRGELSEYFTIRNFSPDKTRVTH